jgi:hypothetical protein
VSAEWIKNKRWYRCEQVRNFSSACRLFVALFSATSVAGCASFGPYHANTPDHPLKSVRGPKGNGRYQLAFIEFGDQGSNLDNSQIKAALDVIHQAERPFLFVYIHGWQNNANSTDVCRFEHFLDTISSFSEATGRKLNVIGAYIAWRGRFTRGKSLMVKKNTETGFLFRQLCEGPAPPRRDRQSDWPQ